MTRGRGRATAKNTRSFDSVNIPAEEEKRIKDKCKTSLSDLGISPDDLNRLIDEAWNHLVKDQDWKTSSFSKILKKRVMKDHLQQLNAQVQQLEADRLATSSQRSSKYIGDNALEKCMEVSNFLVSGSVIPALGTKISKQNEHVLPNYNKDKNYDNETKNVTLPLAVRLASYGADNFMVVCFAVHPWLLFCSHKPDILILNKQLMDACGLSDGLRTISYALVDMVIEAKSSAFEENGNLRSDGISAIGEVVKRFDHASDMMGAVVDGKRILFLKKLKDSYERSEMPKEYIGDNSDGFLELFQYAHPTGKIRNVPSDFLEACKFVRSKMKCPIVPMRRPKDDHWRTLVFGKIPGNQKETVENLQKCESFIKIWRYDEKGDSSFNREVELLRNESLAGKVLPKLISSYDESILIGQQKLSFHVLELSSCGPHTLESFVEMYSKEKSEAWNRTAPLLQKIGQKLVVLHKAGYLHSDVKPSNIVVNPKSSNSSDVFLIDLEFAVKHGERISGYTRPFAAEDLQNALFFANDGNSESLNNLEVRFRYDLESLFLTIKRLFIQHDFISDCSLYDPKYKIPLDKVNKRRVKDEEPEEVIRYLHSFVELLKKLKEDETSSSGATYDFSAVNEFFKKSYQQV